jgi:hypothetical protein
LAQKGRGERAARHVVIVSLSSNIAVRIVLLPTSAS